MEHLLYGKSDLLCTLLASMYTTMLSRSCVICTGLIVPILKKSSLNPNMAKNYRPVTLSSIHTKMLELTMIPERESLSSDFVREGEQAL